MKKFILTTIIILTSFLVLPKVNAQNVEIGETYVQIKEFGTGTMSSNIWWGDIYESTISPYYISNIYLNVKSDDVAYKANSIYTLTFQFTMFATQTEYFSLDDLNFYFYDELKTSTTKYESGLNNSNVDILSASRTQEDLSLIIKVQFRPRVDINYIQLNLGIRYSEHTPDLSFFSFQYINLDVVSDATDAILNQTQVIEDNFAQTNDKIDSLNQTQQETNNQLNDLNNNINNDNTDEATNEASEFFSTFQTDTFGLTSIITAPLTLIQSITSTTCSPLGLPLPYVDETLNLPCLSSIYEEHFGVFLDIYQTITFGIVAYWVCVRIFNLVKDFKNPEHDEIEVLDL